MTDAPSSLDRPEPPSDLPPIPELARMVENRLHESIGSFTLDGARLYGVNVDGVERLRLCFLAQNTDVYDLLSSPASAIGRMFDAAAIVTCGWAAPLGPDGEPDGPPSEHHLRRRVRLVVVIADPGVASVLRFEDDPDEVVVDEGSATGLLATAIDSFWRQSPSVA